MGRPTLRSDGISGRDLAHVHVSNRQLATLVRGRERGDCLILCLDLPTGIWYWTLENLLESQWSTSAAGIRPLDTHKPGRGGAVPLGRGQAGFYLGCVVVHLAAGDGTSTDWSPRSVRARPGCRQGQQRYCAGACRQGMPPHVPQLTLSAGGYFCTLENVARPTTSGSQAGLHFCYTTVLTACSKTEEQGPE